MSSLTCNRGYVALPHTCAVWACVERHLLCGPTRVDSVGFCSKCPSNTFSVKGGSCEKCSVGERAGAGAAMCFSKSHLGFFGTTPICVTLASARVTMKCARVTIRLYLVGSDSRCKEYWHLNASLLRAVAAWSPRGLLRTPHPSAFILQISEPFK